jgi:hypothetical protein
MPAQRNAKPIVDAIRDELGIDAYHLYEEERYSITAEILRAIATACGLEFIKGLTGFKGMGEQMREEAHELIRRWRAREDLTEFARSERIDMITAEALAALPPTVTHEKRQAARASLEAALIQFGLSGDDAKSHAHQIEDIVLGKD